MFTQPMNAATIKKIEQSKIYISFITCDKKHVRIKFVARSEITLAQIPR